MYYIPCPKCYNSPCVCWPSIPKINIIPDKPKPIEGILKEIKWPKDNDDKVNHPSHYKHNRKGIECIDAIEASMSKDEFLGYLKGNILKYLWRYKYKNGVEDIEKAFWYLNKFRETYKKED